MLDHRPLEHGIKALRRYRPPMSSSTKITASTLLGAPPDLARRLPKRRRPHTIDRFGTNGRRRQRLRRLPTGTRINDMADPPLRRRSWRGITLGPIVPRADRRIADFEDRPRHFAPKWIGHRDSPCLLVAGPAENQAIVAQTHHSRNRAAGPHGLCGAVQRPRPGDAGKLKLEVLSTFCEHHPPTSSTALVPTGFRPHRGDFLVLGWRCRRPPCARASAVDGRLRRTPHLWPCSNLSPSAAPPASRATSSHSLRPANIEAGDIGILAVAAHEGLDPEHLLRRRLHGRIAFGLVPALDHRRYARADHRWT